MTDRFDPITGTENAAEGCGCPLCTTGPLEKSCAVSWALLLLANQSQRYCDAGVKATPEQRDAIVSKAWSLLERGGFTAEQARALVVDLKPKGATS